MQSLVYRDPTDRLLYEDTFAYSRALQHPYADHEPVSVTKARREIESWFATIQHFIATETLALVPARIYFAYNLWLTSQNPRIH